MEQWRSQEFPMGIGGLGAEPPVAEGKGVWGAKPPALGKFILQFFYKNNAFLCIFRPK